MNSDNRTVESLPFSALASVTVQDDGLDSQLMLDKLRVRSELGSARLQDLQFSSRGRVPPAPRMIHLRELVSHVVVIPSSPANGT